MDPGIIAALVAGGIALTGVVLSLRKGTEQAQVTAEQSRISAVQDAQESLIGNLQTERAEDRGRIKEQREQLNEMAEALRECHADNTLLRAEIARMG